VICGTSLGSTRLVSRGFSFTFSLEVGVRHQAVSNISSTLLLLLKSSFSPDVHSGDNRVGSSTREGVLAPNFSLLAAQQAPLGLSVGAKPKPVSSLNTRATLTKGNFAEQARLFTLFSRSVPCTVLAGCGSCALLKTLPFPQFGRRYEEFTSLFSTSSPTLTLFIGG
jgi:hypothetical protein